MKKRIINGAILLLILTMSSCKKGDTGPQGPPGVAGERGTSGSSGPAGKDGNLILNGTAAPADGLGSAGDYYLNTANSTLYGPKTDGGWGKPTSLQGPRGATGAQGPKGDRGETGARGPTGAEGPKGDAGATGPRGTTGAQGPKGEKGDAGSQILSGTVSPTTEIGRNGDYYFHSTTGALFGPKSDAGWGAGIVLRGVQGPKGDKGDRGDLGPQGERGPKGDQGDTGTANVIYSEWIRAEWDFQNSRSRSLTINGIQALQNPEKSSVHLYMRFGVENANYALPYTEFWNDGNVTTDYTFGQNYINARIIGTGVNIDPFQYNEIYFRYIIIPGGIAASAKTNRIDLNNLDAVSKAFNIPMM